jgi:hypothetical protein
VPGLIVLFPLPLAIVNIGVSVPTSNEHAMSPAHEKMKDFIDEDEEEE